MLLRNLQTVDREEKVDITIQHGKILAIERSSASSNVNDDVLEFDDVIVFPGLINSHDHLEFNLFPQLGNHLYSNYVEWGDDIHKQDKEIIEKVLQIPVHLRVQWGIYKNLLNGITTVVNHGPKVQVDSAPINIWQNCRVLHSVKLEKRWKYKLNRPFGAHLPFAIHIGEGTDNTSHDEIDSLIKWNLFKRDLVGIHAVAMDEKQAMHFKAIVWCPDSNFFLLGRTAQIDKLKANSKILFGTDSTLSAHWSLWEHLRLARQQLMLTDTELYNSLTVTPAELWPIKGYGSIVEGNSVDIVIAKKKESSSMDSFFALTPEDILLVMHNGNIVLFDVEIYSRLKGFEIANFSKVTVGNRGKYVWGNLPGLIRSVKEIYPDAPFPVSC